MLGHMAAEVIQTHLKCIVASCYEKHSRRINGIFVYLVSFLS